MAVTSKEPGELGLAIIESLAASRPGQRKSLETAWRAASGRLWKKWTDPQFWYVTFADMPSDNKSWRELQKAFEAFYTHPGDTSLARALRQLLQAPGIFSSGAIMKAVREYVETISEELFLADAVFRETLQASPDPQSQEIVKRATPLLMAEPAPEETLGPAEPPYVDQPPALEEPEQSSAEAEEALSGRMVAMLEQFREPAPSEEQAEPEEAPAKPLAEEPESAAPAESRKPKPYEVWNSYRAATEEILKIQQQSEDLSPSAASMEEEMAPEQPTPMESAPAEVDPWAPPDATVDEALYHAEEFSDVQPPAEEPTFPLQMASSEAGPQVPPVEAVVETEAPAELPPSASTEDRKDEASEGRLMPVEMELRAELTSEAEAKKAARAGTGSLMGRLGKLFSRPKKEKAPVIPSLPEEPSVPAIPSPPEELPISATSSPPEELPALAISDSPETVSEDIYKSQRPEVETLPEAVSALNPVEEAQPQELPVKSKKKASRKTAKARAKRPKQTASAPRFVGREAELARIVAWLQNSQQPVVIGQDPSVDGFGGVGKTWLAREYVERYRQNYKGGVFWIHCADPDLIPHQVAALAAGPRGRSLDLRVKRVLAEWQTDKPRLLVFTDCAEFGVIRPWLPSQGGCQVLVTTPSNEWEPGIQIHFLQLGPFVRSESLALLQRHYSDPKGKETDLDAIAAGLHDSPLAVHLAGSLLFGDSLQLRPKELAQLLQEADLHQHHWLRTFKDLPGSFDLRSWLILKVILDRLNPEEAVDRVARKLLQWISACAPSESISRDFLSELLDNADADGSALEASLTRLSALGLVEMAKTGQVQVHPVIARFVAGLSSDQIELQRVEKVILATAVRLNHTSLPDAMSSWLPHLKAITDRAVQRKNSEMAARLSNELGYSLESAEDFQGAQTYFERALTINHRTLGQVHPETATCLTNLGHLLARTGDYKNARMYYEEALDIRQKLLGEDHPDTARSLNNLGYVLQLMGDYKKALPCYEQALSIRRKILGEKDLETAVCLANLGSLSQAMGDQSSARHYYEQALSIRRVALGEEHAETAASLNDLGCFFMAVGEYGPARVYLERALAVRKKIFGESHPDTARSLANLGELYLAKDQCKEAAVYFEQALGVQKQMLGETSLETATTLNRLGSALLALGDYSGARSHLEEALTIREKVQGQARPEVAAGLDQLSSLSEAEGETVEAQEYQDKAQAIRTSLGVEKKPRFTGLSKRGRVIVASLFVLALAIFGWNILVPGPKPITLNWNLSNPGSIPLLQPFKLFARKTATSTVTSTLTPTRTATPTFTATSTSTHTPVKLLLPIQVTKTGTSTNVPPKLTPTRTYYFWTNTPSPTVRPPVQPPTDTPTYTPLPTNTPTLHIVIPPTDTPAPTNTPTPHIVVPPTDTPEPPPTETPTP